MHKYARITEALLVLVPCSRKCRDRSLDFSVWRSDVRNSGCIDSTQRRVLLITTVSKGMQRDRTDKFNLTLLSARYISFVFLRREISAEHHSTVLPPLGLRPLAFWYANHALHRMTISQHTHKQQSTNKTYQFEGISLTFWYSDEPSESITTEPRMHS